MTETKMIYQLIPKIIDEIGAIPKNRQAGAGGGGATFMFRGIDQAMAALQPLLAKHGVFFATKVLSVSREVKTSNAGKPVQYTNMLVRFRFYAPDGSSTDVTTAGEAMDSGDKSSNKAMSTALKYAIFHLFCVPTEDQKDSDSETNWDLAPMERPRQQQQPNPNRPPQGRPPVKPRSQQQAQPAPNPAAPPAQPGPVAQQQAAKPISGAQIKDLHALMQLRGWTRAQVIDVVKHKYKVDDPKTLNVGQFNSLMFTVQQKTFEQTVDEMMKGPQQ